MTDFNFCCLCASDEGVFLDIFTATNHQLGNRSFLKEFETCLSFKVKKNENLSSKLCHKCAIELGECNRFVHKYRQAISKPKTKTSKSATRRSCCLCSTTANNKYFFALAKDFRSTVTCLQKVYECLKLQITPEEAEGKLICLSCRYHLDVLYDLKKLAREVPPKLQIIAKTKAIVANLPKTETFVVSRKTTVIRQPKIELQTPLRSDSEYDGMARRRQLRSNKVTGLAPAAESKPRICGQCKTSIEGGTDMYRLHKVGVTVCKMCWITMDPLKSTRASKRKRNDQAESKSTKLCTVFLKDVLGSASSKEDALQKVTKVEKAAEKEVIYIVSSDSSTDEEQPDNSRRRNLRRRWCGKACKSDQEFDRKSKRGIKRTLKEEDDGEKNGSKKLKPAKKTAVNISANLRRSTRSHNSDSEILITRLNRLSQSVVEGSPQSLRSSNNIQPEDKLGKKKGNKKLPKSKDEVKSKSEDLSGTEEDGVGRKLRKVRTQVPLALESELSESLRVEKSQRNIKRKKVSVGSKPVSKNSVEKKLKVRSVVDKNLSAKQRAAAKRNKTLMMVSFPFKLKDPYECKVCGTICRNKVVGMKHELTHFKQVEIKIEKLNIAHDFQTIENNSPTREISQEPSDDGCSLDSSQTNRKLSEPEIPAPVDNEDEDNRPDDKTPSEKCVPSASGSELSQKNAESTEVENAEESDAVAPVEQPVAKEPTLAANESRDETTDKVVPELALENEESRKENDTVDDDATEKQTEDDLPTESHTDDVDDSGNKDASKIAEEDDTVKESVEKPDENVDDIEDKISVEEKKDEKIVPSVVPSQTENENEAGGDNIDLGEEMESDTDIRIVDTGSSAEDSSEHTEKEKSDVTNATDSLTPKDATETKDADIKSKKKEEEEKEENDAENAIESSTPKDATDKKNAEIEPTEEEKKSKDASDDKVLSKDELEAIAASNTEPEKNSENESVAENQPTEASSKNEEEISEKVKSPSDNVITDSVPSIKTAEVNGKIEISTTSTVTEILQEVIDLASAEVQKRAEREDERAETLEDISNEINKTALESTRSIEAETSERTDNDEIETDTTLNDLN